MGADIADWQIRYEDGERTIVEYRSAVLDPIADPALKTVYFRDLVPPRPQCTLLGIQYQDGTERVGDLPRDYTVNAAALGDPWFSGTGLAAGSTLASAVGYEWDALVPGCAVPTPTVLFHYEGAPSNADAVRYTAPSGARVFSSGSLNFVKGLDPYPVPDSSGDPRLQSFMRNALADLTGGAASGVPPLNLAPPLLGGSAEVGKALTVDSTGTWSGNPTGYAYQWKRCNAGGSACATIAGQTGQSYALGTADAGSTIRAEVTAGNSAGTATSSSDESGVVQAAGTSFGTSTVQASTCGGGVDFLDADGPWAVSAPLILTQAHAYVRGNNEDEQLRVVVYADAGGNPGAYLRVSAQVTIAAGAPGRWVDFPFPNPTVLPTGSYWLGFWLGPIGGGALLSCTNGIAGIERYQYAPYSSSGLPPSSWGIGGSSTSRYALFASGNTPLTNVTLPTISGSALQGQTLTASTRQLERRPDQLLVSVAPVQQLGLQLQQHLGRDRPELRPRLRRRRNDDPGCSDRDQRRRLRIGDLEPDRGRPDPEPSGQHRAADDRRNREAGADPDRLERQLEQQPDQLRLSVAPMQQLRLQLQQHLRRDRPELRPRLRRRRSDDPGGGDRDQCRRLSIGDLEPDRSRPGSEPSGQHGAADDRRNREAGADPDRLERQLEQQPDQLRLSVAPMQQLRLQLQQHLGRDRPELRPRLRRRRRRLSGWW